MSKHIENVSHRHWEPPFIELMAPTHALSEGILAGLSALKDLAADRFKTWKHKYEVNRTAAALSSLEDHVLKDIGVRREDIYAVAHYVVDDPSADIRDLFKS